MAKRKKKGFDAGTAASTAQGIKGGLELYNNWNTAAQAGTPVLRGLAADYGSGIAGQGAAAFPGTVGAADATAGALGTAGGTAADVAGTAGGMVGTTLGEAIPALGQAYGIFNLIKQGIQSGTYQNLFTPGKDKLPSDYQSALVTSAANASRDLPGSPVTTPDARHAIVSSDPRYDWSNLPFVNGNYMTPSR